MTVKVSQKEGFAYTIKEYDSDFSRFIVLDKKEMKQLSEILKGLGF